MIWAGTGVLWTVAGGVPKSLGLLDRAAAAEAADADLNVSTNTFVGANKNIFLSQTNPSVLQISQASVPALAAATTR